uniref:N/A n=1 Tax=Ganoderma boninense TaxID=34458 RepID=A0A5K1JUK2_9APHY|nr:N/A [Ganoderma boninense]
MAARAVHVHISNLAAQTGASLFLHRNAPPFHPAIGSPAHTQWVYDKTENLSLADLARARNATHVIAEVEELHKGDRKDADAWIEVARVAGFDGWRFGGVRALAQGRFGGLGDFGSVLEMRRSAKLVVLERRETVT